MKNCTKDLLFLLVMAFSPFWAQATTEFDQNVTPEVIFGSGNTNGSFTTNRDNGIELGLRAKIPFSGLIKSTGDGRYQYTISETDHDNNPGSDNRWNFDWTVNTDFDDSNGTKLDQYTYEIGMDADPGAGTNYLIFDPITPTVEAPYYDHSIGDNSTGNGAGIEAPSNDAAAYASLLSTGNVLQQSWRYAFFSSLSPLNTFNPNNPGTYNVYIAIKDLEGNLILKNEIVVNIVLDPEDDNVTPEVIFGSGNSNGSFTLNRSSGVEVGLRAKIPFSGLVRKIGNARYHYSLAETDHDSNPGSDNRWNFDWTINTDFDASNGTELNQYSYELGLDADPGAGTNFLIFDPVTPTTQIPYYDHSMGDNSTGNGAGIEAPSNDAAAYANLLATKHVLQQSWRYSFFPEPPLDGYDPSVPGTYNVYLSVKDLNGATVSRTEIVVVIGGLDYDENVTSDVIFGSGNANGNFTTDRKSSVEVGLRAKIPFTGTLNSNADGTYSYSLQETDYNPPSPKAWNFDWSINTDYDDGSGNNVSNYTYEMGLDSDPGLGTNYLTFDPITPSEQVPFFDHAFGDNNTGNGGGTNGNADNYQSLIDNNNLVQNSWRYAFFQSIAPLDTYNPDIAGTYTVYLAVKEGENIIAKSEIQILIEGAPQNTVPVTAPDHFLTFEDSTLTVEAISGLLINDTDADLNTLQIANPGLYQAGGIGGDITLALDGSFIYTPPSDANGTATFEYFVTDTVNLVASRLSIEVISINDAPDFSILGDVAYYNLTGTGNLLQVIEDYSLNLNFGPIDESNQSLVGYTAQIISDSNNVLNDIVLTNEGYLILDLSYNFGTALVGVSMQDDGGSDFGGDDVSETKLFSVSNFDLIFANGFESLNGLLLVDYLEQVQFYSSIDSSTSVEIDRPYYDFVSNQVHFMGYKLQLDNDYQSRKVMMLLKSWMREVLHTNNMLYTFE